MGPFQIEIIKNNHLNNFVYVRERDGSERSREFFESRTERSFEKHDTTRNTSQFIFTKQNSNKLYTKYSQSVFLGAPQRCA